MKKAIVLALVVMLTLSLAMPAAAVISPVGSKTSQTATAPLPEVVNTELLVQDDWKLIIEMTATNDVTSMSAEARQAYAAAQAALAEAVPEGMKTQYFFYASVLKAFSNGDRALYNDGVEVTVKIDNVNKVVVKEFIDGKWVELETVDNADGTYTIKGVVNGPMAIFTA